MHYRRSHAPGGSYFITAALADRKQKLLLEKIDDLKYAFKKVKNAHSFTIDAIVILPDHFHMIITLPDADVAYSKRLSLIKCYFTRRIEKGELISKSRQLKRERGIWQRRFWEYSSIHRYIREGILSAGWSV